MDAQPGSICLSLAEWRRQSNTNTNGIPKRYTYSYANSYAYTNSHAYSNSYGYAYTDSYTNANRHLPGNLYYIY
jgi:hypothetical protein